MSRKLTTDELRALDKQHLWHPFTQMQEWVAEHRRNPVGVDNTMVETFASWVNERSAIAGQTAALTREGAASAWH